MIGYILKELIAARGQQKISALKKCDEGAKQILLYTYNKNYVYHVRPAPVSPVNVYDRIDPLHMDEITLLENLNSKILSGNDANNAVERVARAHGPLIKLILARDLQCGIAAKSINKAIPGLIPMFEVQLAKEVPLDKVSFPCLAQLKYDGVRLITTIKDGEVKFRTRNGKEVNLPALRRVMKVAPIDNMMLDGELIIQGGRMTERTSVSGMVNSAIHGGFINESSLEYAVFDHMPIGDFEASSCSMIYSNRYKCATAIVKAINSMYVAIARNQLVTSPEEVNELTQQVYSDGQEGIILKSPTHLYTFKRSKDWIKIKEIKTVDLKVTTWEEGAGKYEGLIGSLHCEGIAEGKKVTVFVGSGLSDNDRASDYKMFHNKTIEVKYNSLIQDSRTNQWSLFLPRFSHIRIDK